MPLFIIDDLIDFCVDVWMSRCGVANFDLKNLKINLVFHQNFMYYVLFIFYHEN